MNLVVLEGRIANNLELRYSTGENANASLNFSVAVSRDFKNSEGKYDADFIRCVAFRNQAEFISKYFKKGDPISIVGNIRTGSYTNKDGVKVYTTDVYVDKVHFVVGGKSSDGSAQNQTKPAQTNDDFMNIPDDVEEELPWS